MGSLLDHYSNLTDVLRADYQARRAPERDILISRFLRPLLPATVRVGTGQIIDLKDRSIGPLDAIACADTFPLLGEGVASQFLADGVAFCLQVRNWSKEDLTQFSDMAHQVKTLDRKSKTPIFCAAVAFEPLQSAQVLDFMKSSAGASVDGVLSLGEHITIRNTLGWYGDPQFVPFVSERGAGESMKAFAMLLLHLCQNLQGLPFALADYQHL